MNILEDSHLEALAFNYLNFGFLTLFNNLWTWLALGFWKIRAPRSELLPPSDDPTTDPSPAVSDPDAVSEPARVPAVVGNGGADVDGVTKGKFKFTLYYEDVRETESEEMLAVTEVWDERDGRSEWWESWEGLLRMRSGENENGWYTCQDLTAINGNVVRFWNGEFTKDSSSCVRVW